jgi:hypothetical protein
MSESLFFVLLSAIATIGAVEVVRGMRPLRPMVDEWWLHYYLRIYFAPGNAVFIVALGWASALRITDQELGVTTYALGVAWVLFLWAAIGGIRREAA